MSGSRFSYAALDARGARVRGAIDAESAAEASALLRSQGLVPVTLRSTQGNGIRSLHDRPPRPREFAELLFVIGQLLGAGSHMTAAVSMARAHAASPSVARLCDHVEREIASGRTVSEAFASGLGERAGYVPALIAAGEASGDLAIALQTVANQLRAEGAVRAAFWSAVSYPIFIAAASLAAFFLLLVVVVPSLGPLLDEVAGPGAGALRVLLGLSHLMTVGWLWMILGLGVFVGGLILMWRVGLVAAPVEALLLDGPARKLVSALVYGRVAATLGPLLQAGVPAPDAIRLAASAVDLQLARDRLESAAKAIYEGAGVAASLGACKGLPPTIVRMATVGEESGDLGGMLGRAGELERTSALRRLEALTRWLGPSLIVLLGMLIGAVMAALLSAVAGVGSAVLD